MKTADNTFLGGDPVKGCSGIYDELEYLTRRFAVMSEAAGWWRQVTTHRKRKTKDLLKDAWAHVLDDVDTFLDLQSSRPKCPEVTSAMIAQVKGLTPHRNAAGHKPKTVDALIKRDSQLRTRFETARDLLLEWHEATSSVRAKVK